MISSLSGTVRHKDLNSLIVDVSGVGYKVLVATETILGVTVSSPIFLWTHLAIRENAMELFGFSDKENLDAFELLITISGIGPRTALNILNVATPAMLRQAVASTDTSYLTRVSGIGKKNAEKIVLELKDKMKILDGDKSVDIKSEGDVLEALVALGYSEREARDAIKKLPKDVKETSERVKHALKNLNA